ncbi:MAG: T9SS type A sorting domain-containing protein, partial [Bacteroidota bacterium]
LGDFLTATFSHPSMTGFMFWNFWDVDTWANPGANLYDANFNETPAHAVFTDLVFQQWWTDADLVTDANGEVSLRGFKGDYEVTINCGGEDVTATFSLTADGTKTVDCSGLVSAKQPTLPADALEVFPNPTSGPWTVTNRLSQTLDGELFDASGKQVWRGYLLAGRQQLPVAVPPGFYSLRVTDGNRVRTLKLVRH